MIPFAAGGWLDPSAPPASVREPLRVTGRAAADTVRVLCEPLAVAEISAPLPRAVGGHQTHVCGVSAMRVPTP